jgi:hypothetical protein
MTTISFQRRSSGVFSRGGGRMGKPQYLAVNESATPRDGGGTGAPGGSRTPNRLIRSQARCPIELRGLFMPVSYHNQFNLGKVLTLTGIMLPKSCFLEELCLLAWMSSGVTAHG